MTTGEYYKEWCLSNGWDDTASILSSSEAIKFAEDYHKHRMELISRPFRKLFPANKIEKE